jgi:hypothetical protein
MEQIRKLGIYQVAAILLFIGILILIFITFRNYGISWDERAYLLYGKALMAYYLGVLRGVPDMTAVSIRNLNYDGGVYDLFSAIMVRLLGRITSDDILSLHHLVNALTGFLGLIGAWATARLLAGDKAAFWSALFLAITPVYYGHLFFNPKDIPFAVGYLWSLYFLIRILSNFPRVRWQSLALFGAASGLTLGIRIGGIFLIVYLGLALLWNYWRVYRSGAGARFNAFIRLVVLPFGFAGLIAYVVMLAFWPWAQQDPIRNPFRVLFEMRNYYWSSTVLYRGHLIAASDLPADYILRYLAISLPELLLLLLLAGAVVLIVRWYKGKRTSGSPSLRILGSSLLVLSVITPIITAFLNHSTVYDGMRHFIFVVPPLACLAGLSFQFLLDQLAAKNIKLAHIATLLVFVYLVYQVSVMARLHPYEYIYYNQLVGGVAHAYQQYETDYWGTAASQAAKWLAQSLEDNSRTTGRKVKVFITGANIYSAQYYFPDWIVPVRDKMKADYMIGGIRRFGWEKMPGVELFTVARMGVPLVVVKDLK